MPPSTKPRLPQRPSRPSPPAPRPEAAGIAAALEARLSQALGQAGPPASLQCAAALLQALRATFAGDLPHWLALVPQGEPGRPRDPNRDHSLDLADLRVLYRALRVAWLAELVFGGADGARRWLCSPKRRLHGRVPLLLCQHGRYAVLIEQWLINIDEGNGP
ncbi:MbcA/ParS/Xre antitoxin family protein [Achromobacter insuavis]|uniref:MbcA/ParS/Xre antitoxin family protein n=1 Tax=Achromobacter insuavis TaxID=1287735 RepID=UPI001EEBFE28|nr:MbcA/ParS/Xre antitoxin family protein [Achromobacter insuavis]